MDEEKEMKKRFRKNLPRFVQNIDPAELIPYLPCLSTYNKEQLGTRQRMNSRMEAVNLLHQILDRKKDGCRQLVEALRNTERDPDCLQSELADLLDPPRPESNLQEPQPEETEFVMGFQRTKQSERLNKINGQQSEMAYKTDCFQKNIKGPCDEHTAFRDLPYKVNVVLKQLDITGFDDWKSLAGNLGYTVRDVEMFGSHKVEGSPTLALIQNWGQKEDATLGKLMKILNEVMERKDIVSELSEITGYKCPEIIDIEHTLHNNCIDFQTAVQKTAEPNQTVQTCRKDNENKETDKLKTTLLYNRVRSVPDTTQCIPSTTGNIGPSEDKYDAGVQASLNDMHFGLNTITGQEKVVPSSNRSNENSTAAHHKHIFPVARNSIPVNESGATYCKHPPASGVEFSRTKHDSAVHLKQRSEEYSRDNDDILTKPVLKSPVFRYSQSENGHLRMIAYGNSNSEQMNFQKLKDEFNPTSRRSPVHQQDSRSSGGSPVQAEPSISSDTFINLKKQRKTETVRPRVHRVRNTTNVITRQEPSETMIGPSVENYVKLHTENAPSFGDFSETTESFPEYASISMTANSNAATCNEGRVLQPENSICTNNSFLHYADNRTADTSENHQAAYIGSNICDSSSHMTNESEMESFHEEGWEVIKGDTLADQQVNRHTFINREPLTDAKEIDSVTMNNTAELVLRRANSTNQRQQSERSNLRMNTLYFDSHHISETNENRVHSNKDDGAFVDQNTDENVLEINNDDEARENDADTGSWSSFSSLGLGVGLAASGALALMAVYKSFK